MMVQRPLRVLALLPAFVVVTGAATDSWGRSDRDAFHLGRPPTAEEVRAWDIDVAPDGQGLPAGRGSVEDGAKVYEEFCVRCHGATGVEGPMPKLVGGQGTLTTDHPVKTIGSYWSYATTLYDYVYRTMPFSAPQSLSPDQVYAVVAWLLFRNGLIDEDFVLTRETLPSVRMPYHGYVTDPRPDVMPASQKTSSSLGDVHFPTSGSMMAQRPFLRGALLLHNFEYDDARAAFQRAQKVDPDFAMAYWGEAMTMNHPLWGEEDLQHARDILRRLAPTSAERMAKAPTERERGYLRAVEALYGEGEKHRRDLRYMAAMRALAEQFPQDENAQTWYALSMLGAARGNREDGRYREAASIAQRVFEANPRHPGAAHYLIHALDDPAHAALALNAARAYAEIAPAAPHAQHMPSHVFMALGMWDDVVKANERSWAASEDRRIRRGLGVETRSYHTAYWLMYARLQQGRADEAKAWLAMAEEDAQRVPSRSVRGYRAAMRATYIVEGRAWDVSGLDRDRSTLRFSAATSEVFAVGMSAVQTGRMDVANQSLDQLRQRVSQAADEESANHVLSGKVMTRQLAAMIFIAQGNVDDGLSLLQEAALLEDTIPYKYGPPFPVKPSHELLGEVLLRLGKRDAAHRHFTLALERRPQRALSLAGLRETRER